MESLYNLVLKKKQEVSQISCNPTLGAMDFSIEIVQYRIKNTSVQRLYLDTSKNRL